VAFAAFNGFKLLAQFLAAAAAATNICCCYSSLLLVFLTLLPFLAALLAAATVPCCCYLRQKTSTVTLLLPLPLAAATPCCCCCCLYSLLLPMFLAAHLPPQEVEVDHQRLEGHVYVRSPGQRLLAGKQLQESVCHKEVKHNKDLAVMLQVPMSRRRRAAYTEARVLILFGLCCQRPARFRAGSGGCNESSSGKQQLFKGVQTVSKAFSARFLLVV
jgi:hypothetical protein